MVAFTEKSEFNSGVITWSHKANIVFTNYATLKIKTS